MSYRRDHVGRKQSCSSRVKGTLARFMPERDHPSVSSSKNSSVYKYEQTDGFFQMNYGRDYKVTVIVF